MWQRRWPLKTGAAVEGLGCAEGYLYCLVLAWRRAEWGVLNLSQKLAIRICQNSALSELIRFNSLQG